MHVYQNIYICIKEVNTFFSQYVNQGIMDQPVLWSAVIIV